MLLVAVVLRALVSVDSEPVAPSLTGHAQYDMDIYLEPASSQLEVRGTVMLPAVNSARDTIRLLLSSWMPHAEFSVASVTTGPVRISTDSAQGDRSWFVVFDRPVPAGTPVEIRFHYVSDSVRSAQLRVTPAGSLAGGGGEIWYPRLAFDSLAVGALRFHVKPGDHVISNGVLEVARSDTARGVFAYRMSAGAHFGFAAAHYVHYRSTGDRPVNLFLLKARPEASAMLTRIATTLKALEAQFGRLPFPEYSVAEVEFGGSTGGTSEYGFFLADRSYVDRGLDLPFIGHELGHAWWGNLVGTKPGPGRMLLTEGIASFGMLRAIEANEGAAAAERYRQSHYAGAETFNSPAEYFAMTAAALEQPIGTFVPRSQVDILMMHRMANTRGWFVLDMLSREIGREKFAAILRRIVDTHTGAAISLEEFEREVTAGAGRDLTWFFDDWIRRGGAPDYRLQWASVERGVRGSIRQSGIVYRAGVPVEIHGGAGQRITRVVSVRDSSAEFRFDVPFRVTDVVLDPHYTVLRWTDDFRRYAVARAGFTRADFERRFGSAEKAAQFFRSALDSVIDPDTAGVRYSLLYGLAGTLLGRRDTVGAVNALQRALAAPVRSAASLPQAFLLLARLRIAAGDTVGARAAALDALAADAAGGKSTGVTTAVRAFPWLRVR